MLGTCKICGGVPHLVSLTKYWAIHIEEQSVFYCCRWNKFSIKTCNTQYFYIVDRAQNAHTHTHQTHCCIYIASLVMWMHHDVMLFAQGLYCFLQTSEASVCKTQIHCWHENLWMLNILVHTVTTRLSVVNEEMWQQWKTQICFFKWW